jgi:hypothetical protein
MIYYQVYVGTQSNWIVCIAFLFLIYYPLLSFRYIISVTFLILEILYYHLLYPVFSPNEGLQNVEFICIVWIVIRTFTAC